MGLAIYFKDEKDQFVEISTGTDLTSPLLTVHDGKKGDTKTVQLYIRNDDSTKWFSNIIVTPRDLVDADPYGDVIYRETGWGVKLSDTEEEPSSGEWEDILWGEQISLSNIGTVDEADINTYFPFWFYITCPPNEEVKVKTDIILDVSYTENAVA